MGTTEEAAEAPDYHINKQPTTYQKKYQLQNSATYRPPIKIKQINYQPEIFGPWALGPKGCTNQYQYHQQQVAGNNNHEYPRRSHLTDISLANSWRRDVKKHIISLPSSHHLINCQL